MTPKHAKNNELKILKNNFQPSQLASANWDKTKCSVPHLRYKINKKTAILNSSYVNCTYIETT